MEGYARIGITATRKGATDIQLYWLASKLKELRANGPEKMEFHHGDCIGGDAQGFKIASDFGYQTIAHPPTLDKYRAFTASDIILPPRPYMSRNRAIINSIQFLLVVPFDWEEREPRSGTWATYRRAKQIKLPVEVLLWKD